MLFFVDIKVFSLKQNLESVMSFQCPYGSIHSSKKA